MEITVCERTDGRVPVTVFQMKGRVDQTTHTEMIERALEAYAKGTRHLLLDLADVTFLSSAGLKAIHMIFDLLRAGAPEESNAELKKGVREGLFKSAHLKIANPSHPVHQVLVTAGYDMFLEIHPNVETALASF